MISTKNKKILLWLGLGILAFIVYFLLKINGSYLQGMLSRFNDRNNTSTESQTGFSKNQDCSKATPEIKMLSIPNAVFTSTEAFELYSFSIFADNCPLEFFELGTLHIETSMGGPTTTLYDFELYKTDSSGKQVLVSNAQQLKTFPILKEGDDTGDGAFVDDVFQSSMYVAFPVLGLHDIDKDGISKFELGMVLPFNDILTINAGETVSFTLMAKAESVYSDDYISVSMIEDKYKHQGALRFFVGEANNGKFISIRKRFMSPEYTDPSRPSMLWSNISELPHWSGSTDWFGSYKLDLPSEKRLLTAESSEKSKGVPGYSTVFSAINRGHGRSELAPGKNMLLDFALYANNGDIEVSNLFFWTAELSNAVIDDYWLVIDDKETKLDYTVDSIDGDWESLKFEFPEGFVLKQNEFLELTLFGNATATMGDIVANFSGAQGIDVHTGDLVGFTGVFPYNVADHLKQGSISIVKGSQKNINLIEGEQDLLKFLLLPSNEDIWLNQIDLSVFVSSHEDVNLLPKVKLIDDITGNIYTSLTDISNDSEQAYFDLSSNPIKLTAGKRRTFTLKGSVNGPLSGPSAIYSFLDLIVYTEGDTSGATSVWFEKPYEIFIEGKASHTLKYLP